MIRRALATIAALACLIAAGCGSDESAGSSGDQKSSGGGAGKLTAQESATVDAAAKDIQTDCGGGKKTPAVTEGAGKLVQLYEAKGPDAALASGSSTGAKTLDQVLAKVQNQLQKCGAVEESARVLGARAAQNRFS
jgi:hypothetical protein